ncbi:hypothetical protein ACP70R_035788 [Stipagrostis hirtigluma subsp. patula]
MIGALEAETGFNICQNPKFIRRHSSEIIFKLLSDITLPTWVSTPGSLPDPSCKVMMETCRSDGTTEKECIQQTTI